MAGEWRAPVTVVGGGVLGLAVAAFLAERGRAVVVLERAAGLCGGASAASFAWANAHVDTATPEHALRVRALERHRSASAVSDDPWFHALPADVDGAGTVDGGWVDVAAFARAHVGRIRGAGGEVRTGAEAMAVDGATLTLASGERFRTGVVVLAAGAALPSLLPALVPAIGSAAGDRGFVIRARLSSTLDRIAMSDRLNARPDGPGRIALQSLEVERRLAAAGLAATAETAWPLVREIAAEHGIDLAPGDLVEVREAARPVAPDGRPVVGWTSERTYAVLAHSGITLAPLLGELVAAEIDGHPTSAFARYRPDRTLPEGARP